MVYAQRPEKYEKNIKVWPPKHLAAYESVYWTRVFFLKML